MSGGRGEEEETHAGFLNLIPELNNWIPTVVATKFGLPLGKPLRQFGGVGGHGLPERALLSAANSQMNAFAIIR